MQKVLLVSLNSSYPLVHGGAIAQYYFIDGLKNDIEFILCTQVNSQNELKNIKLLQEKQPNLKIYYYNNFKKKKAFEIIGKLIRNIINLILIKKRSRNYAKRQYTWFNNQMDIKWFEVNFNNFNETINEVLKYIEKR